jgi:hypothetical protein
MVLGGALAIVDDATTAIDPIRTLLTSVTMTSAIAWVRRATRRRTTDEVWNECASVMTRFARTTSRNPVAMLAAMVAVREGAVAIISGWVGVRAPIGESWRGPVGGRRCGRPG